MPRPSWGLHRGEDGAMTARAPVFVIKSKWGPLLSWGWLVAPAASSCGCRRRGRLPVAEALSRAFWFTYVHLRSDQVVSLEEVAGFHQQVVKRPSRSTSSYLGCQELLPFSVFG